jgi:hypothetical protein
MRCAARHGSLATHRVVTPPAVQDPPLDFPRGIDLAGTSDYSSGSEHEA